MTSYRVGIPFGPGRIPLLVIPAATLSISGALLAGAHGFETFGGYAPCALCLEQRETHWVALGIGALALIAFWRSNVQSVRILFLSLLAVAYLWSAGAAGFHVGVESGWWSGPTDCGTNLSDFDYQDSLVASLQKQTKAVPCDEVAWRFLGISMAGYNLLVSLGVSVGLLLVLFREARGITWPQIARELNQVRRPSHYIQRQSEGHNDSETLKS